MIDTNISLREASIKYNVEDLTDIEQKLFLISLVLETNSKLGIVFHLEKEITIFNYIKFEIKKFGPSESIVIISDIGYTLDSYKRIINFIDSGENERKYVYNFGKFKDILKDKKFKMFEYHGHDNTTDSNDSLNSEFKESEIYNYYCNENITEIIKIETNTKQLIEQKFCKKVKYPKKIGDLSLNMKYYNNVSLENNIKYIDDISLFKLSKINPFLYDDFSTVLYYFGIKGCGKTTQLLQASIELHNQTEIKMPRLYIDYQTMKKNHNLRKLIFKKELFYLFQNKEELLKFIELGYYKIIKDYDNFFSFFKIFLENILKLKCFTNKIILIIDNINDEEQVNDDYEYINKIIDICKNNSKQIKLIICGNGKFLQEKQKLFINNELFLKSNLNKERYLECFRYNYENDENKNIIPEYIYSNPEYYFNFESKKLNYTKINDFTNYILEEETKVMKDKNFFGKYYSLIYENKSLDKKTINKYYDILPHKYLSFFKTKESIHFKIANILFKAAMKKSIEYQINSQNLIYLLKSEGLERTQIGIFEEKLLTLLFKYNKIPLINLYFEKQNQLEVNELYYFISSKYDKLEQNIIINKPILITQSNFRGKFYDLIILIPITNTENYEAIFVQIGLNKKKDEIKILQEDIAKNHNKYRKGLEKYLNIKITNIYLNFIFYKQTQEDKSSEYDSGSIYCLNNNIQFHLFSLEDFELYQIKDNDFHFEKTSIFEYKFEEKNVLGKKRDKLFDDIFENLVRVFSEEERNILEKMNKNIKNVVKISAYKTIGSIIKNKTFSKKHIYAIIDKSTKIVIIGGIYKEFKNGKLENYTGLIVDYKQYIFYEINFS